MKENSKKSFVLHTDTLSVLDELTDEQAGKLFKAIKNYQLNVLQKAEEIEQGNYLDDTLIRIAFAPFKAQFERDYEAYQDVVEKRRIAGQKGGSSRNNNNQQKQEQANASFDNQNEQEQAKQADSVSDSVSDSVNIYPYQDIVELWNSTCTNHSKVLKLTDARKNKIRIRMEEFGKTTEEQLSVVKRLFEKSQDSKFMRGDNKTGWRASFDWLFENPKNWVKVLEGNYDNEKPTAGKTGENHAGTGERNYDEQF